MEQVVHIVTDSSCDLPRKLVERFKITVVPLIVRFGPEVYQDGELSVEAFWEKAAGPHHPQTSQPSVGVFEELFERLIARGKQVLCLTITGKHSGTFNSARLAAQRFGDAVKVFDSLSLSLGLGLQALAAAQAARAGRSMKEILAMLEDLRARMHLTILLDTLENLRRGGRANGFIAVVDRMTRVLNIKALINVVDGELRLLGAARSFEGGLKRMLRLVERLGTLEHLAVVHTRSQAVAEDMARRLAERTGFPRERIWVRETGAVLSTHAGQGVIGVLAAPTG
ncbi:MAG TPA: DegV family protein [Anaerolineales bacterium]|nr:DegV family protein [Anaerolineae bacterium]HIQ00792.1 DegV family protein [Anaerolineales bacterium]